MPKNNKPKKKKRKKNVTQTLEQRKAQSERDLEKNREEKYEKESSFYADKASFVGGIAIIISIILDIIDIINKNTPFKYTIIGCLIIIAVFGVILATSWVDKIFEYSGVKDFTRFLTVVSTIILIFEKFFLPLGGDELSMKIAFVVISGVIVGGALFLLFKRRENFIDKNKKAS